MKFHKEGYLSLLLAIIVSSLLIYLAQCCFSEYVIIQYLLYAVSVFLLVVILQFFRNPIRNWNTNKNAVIAPADGKVVVIEEVFESEYFKDKRLQVSIFMSPINVHINRFPIDGIVTFAKYHTGKFLVAWDPKSSTDNERTSIAVKNDKHEILFRQIAGALARRIVFYCKEGDIAKQTQEFGFIKFGSRVDLFFPVGTKLNVELNQKVKGGITEIAVA
jgi:phosphatidylserine decarboxylase